LLYIGAQGDLRDVTVRIMDRDGEDVHVERGAHSRVGELVRAAKKWCGQRGQPVKVEYEQVNDALGSRGALLFERLLGSP
jgi:hypothetical protein